MERVYVSEFVDNGKCLWGLFFVDKWGKVQHLEEDFKRVVFGSEAEALAKLEMIEAERRSEDAADAFTLEEARGFAERQRWKFASTYAKSAPHEYLVKKWLSADERLLFERLVQSIKSDSVQGDFYGHRNKYLILGDYYYWYMVDCYPENLAVDLINRTTTDYLEERNGVYYYKGKQ